MRSALAGWSAKNGTTASGTPAAIAISVEPEPPWPTIAAACGITSAWGTQRSTWTEAGSGPRSAGSWSLPTVSSTRTGMSATAPIVPRQRPRKSSVSGTAVPKET